MLGIDAIHSKCRQDWEAHQAAFDSPTSSCLDELIENYPDARFIYSYRPYKTWIVSAERHYTNSKLHNGRGWLVQSFIEARQKTFGAVQWDRDVFGQAWHRWDAKVAGYMQRMPEQFLKISVTEGQGWAALCPFLGLPIPDMPFPCMPKDDVTER